MKLLSNILRAVTPSGIHGRTDIIVMSIEHNSRTCDKGSLFIAIKGTTNDGHQFIEDAIAHGATSIVCEVLPSKIHETVTYIMVEDSREAAADISHEFYDHPTQKMQIIGVTGTNGKTSITFILRQLLEQNGIQCGIIGTTGNYIGTRHIPTSYTTPEAPELLKILSEMVSEGITYVLMEVSSHALVMKRVRGVIFRAALFTNLTHDHLDFHGSMEEYAKAKKILFDMLQPNAVAIVNADSPYSHSMVRDSQAKTLFVGTENTCDTIIHSIQSELTGSHFSLMFGGKNLVHGDIPISIPLIGFFNIENAALCITLAVELGIDINTVQRFSTAIQGAPGRMDTLRLSSGAVAIIDYAHSPDALEKVLHTCRHLLQHYTQDKGKLITVFGCGGNRDSAKRPLMGQCASRLSDSIIITNDNPRTENPEAIAHEILNGFSRILPVEIILDRKEAIHTALSAAQYNDIVLIAGKGHENIQIIGTTHIHSNDRDIVMSFIHSRNPSSHQLSHAEANN